MASTEDLILESLGSRFYSGGYRVEKGSSIEQPVALNQLRPYRNEQRLCS